MLNRRIIRDAPIREFLGVQFDTVHLGGGDTLTALRMIRSQP